MLFDKANAELLTSLFFYCALPRSLPDLVSLFDVVKKEHLSQQETVTRKASQQVAAAGGNHIAPFLDWDQNNKLSEQLLL